MKNRMLNRKKQRLKRRKRRKNERKKLKKNQVKKSLMTKRMISVTDNSFYAFNTLARKCFQRKDITKRY